MDGGKFHERAPVAGCSIKGVRHTQEDRFEIDEAAPAAGVYDGHGGAGVAEFLEGTLLKLVRSCLDGCRSASGVRRRLRRAFAHADRALRARIDAELDERRAARANRNKGPPVRLPPRQISYEMGACAVMAAVVEVRGRRHLAVANTGDCVAVLCRGDGKAERLTVDHRPTASTPGGRFEIARVQLTGGTVECDRVEGPINSLAISRAFGDFLVSGVTSVPFVRCRPLSGTERFVVLCSDGVTDLLSDQDICDTARDGLPGGTEGAASEVVRSAYFAGSSEGPPSNSD